MEAAGRIRVDIEAKLSRGPSIPVLRRQVSNDRWHEVGISVSSGNFISAKPRGVVNGIDFGATGEVKKIDVVRIKERLDSNCIVMLSNLGYSSSGQVLNCNTYEVATACATALQAEKLLCLLDGPVCDENQRHLRFMTLQEADRLICERASQSYTAADYVKAVAGPSYMKSLGIDTSSDGLPYISDPGDNGTGAKGSFKSVEPVESSTFPPREATYRTENSLVSGIAKKRRGRQGFAIGGEERLSRTYGYLSELTAAVYVCRGGVGRVHLLDSNIQGALLLELYTRDGIGTMVSKYELVYFPTSDSYFPWANLNECQC
jgi:amino-acid N-acetyltransferase